MIVFSSHKLYYCLISLMFCNPSSSSYKYDHVLGSSCNGLNNVR